ncbi:MAG: hypothetical protein QW587_00630 [Candidatus Bathyarchaeia archaeon]
MWKKSRVLPIHTLIVESLLRRQGNATDEELFEELRKEDEGFSVEQLRAALFKLEVEGIVRVTSLAKNRKRVELLQPR